MRRRTLSFWLLGLVGLLLPMCFVTAQPPYRPYNPYAPPVFSPYLNLLRRGTNPAINYYGLVRPEMEWRGRVNQLQTEINTIAPYAAGAEPTSGLPYTGHPTQFLNLTHFYPSSALAGPAVRRPVAPQQQQRLPQQQQTRTAGQTR